MKINASARFVRVSPSKVRPLARLLRGLPLNEALTTAGFNLTKGAFYIGKLLKSMAGNLAVKKMNSDDFNVEKVVIEQGPTLKRFWPRSRGMVRPVVKKTCHIKIILADNKDS